MKSEIITDKIVKLFKLFKEDVLFSFGYDKLPNGITQAKAIFQTPTIYFAALVINDSYLLNKVLGPCTAAKNYVQANYANKIVLSSNMLLAAINRLLMFTKNSIDKVNMLSVYATITLTTGNEFIITDKLGNQEEKVLNLLLQGMSNQEIANELFVSIHTIRNHIANIYKKTGMKKKELKEKCFYKTD